MKIFKRPIFFLKKVGSQVYAEIVDQFDGLKWPGKSMFLQNDGSDNLELKNGETGKAIIIDGKDVVYFRRNGSLRASVSDTGFNLTSGKAIRYYNSINTVYGIIYQNGDALEFHGIGGKSFEINSLDKLVLSKSLQAVNYTDAERNASTPTTGDIIFNTTSSKLQVYDGAAWQNLH